MDSNSDFLVFKSSVFSFTCSATSPTSLFLASIFSCASFIFFFQYLPLQLLQLYLLGDGVVFAVVFYIFLLFVVFFSPLLGLFNAVFAFFNAVFQVFQFVLKTLFAGLQALQLVFHVFHLIGKVASKFF